MFSGGYDRPSISPHHQPRRRSAPPDADEQLAGFAGQSGEEASSQWPSGDHRARLDSGPSPFSRTSPTTSHSGGGTPSLSGAGSYLETRVEPSPDPRSGLARLSPLLNSNGRDLINEMGMSPAANNSYGATRRLESQPEEEEEMSVADMIAEVASRRSQKRARTLRSNTPDRWSEAEPRLLRSELEGSAPRSSRDGGASGPVKTGEVRKLHGAAMGQGGDLIRDAGVSITEEEEENVEEEAGSILAICFHRNKLGVAAYREEDNTIEIHETNAFPSDMADTVEGIKLAVRPRRILIDMNMCNNVALLDMLIAPLVDGGDKIEHTMVKKMCWDYQSAKRGICANLQVQSLAHQTHGGIGVNTSSSMTSAGRVDAKGEGVGGGDSTEAFNRLGSIIDFEAQQQIRALGALLTYLQAKVFTLESSEYVVVASVKQLDVSGSMRIDDMTLRSLGILSEEFHPNMVSGKGRSKEGFSVFGLFDRTRSVSGRRCLKQWMLKPLHDIGAITARQDGVEVLMQTENAEICRRLRSHLGKSHDMAQVVQRIKKVAARFADWCKLIQSIESTLDIRECLVTLKGSADAVAAAAAAAAAIDGGMRDGNSGHQGFFARLLDGIDPIVLRCCLEGLSDVIDPSATMEDREVVIRSGYDDELDEKKCLLADLPDILRAVGKLVLQENPVLDELSVEYVPQIGFLTALNKQFSHLAPSSFSFAFAQGDTVYFKNPKMHEVDDDIGDIQAKITDRQAAIMRALEEALLEQEMSLHAAAAATAELDAAMSLASVASDFGFVRPEVVEDNVIIIKNGRHPLQELTVERFIPNDTYIADGSRVALITGANCSGKSVYLKQVGVAVFLAHVGSFVPAERAIIGLTDRIFTRIATVETSALPQSSFTIDVNQVAHMVRSGTPRSLLLIDEFGKGTAPPDGIGLVAALLRHLSRTGCKCLLTLHFHEIFSEGLVKIHGPDEMRTELPDVSVFRMDVHVPTLAKPRIQGSGLAFEDASLGDANDWTTAPPTPLFKLTPGIASTSHGIACAELAGLPDDVLCRAREIAGYEDRGEPIQARKGGRSDSGSLTLASAKVQDALRLFLNPPEGVTWQHAPDGLIDSLLATVETLCGLAIAGG